MRLQLKIIVGSLLLLFLIIKTLNYTLTKNISISEPTGYYLKLPIFSKIQRGNRYLICINNIRYSTIMKHFGLPGVHNQCKNNLPYLIKQVAGIPNDVIEVTKDGILINNQLQPNSQSFTSAHDIKLYPLPIGYKTTLRQNEYFMLGITPHSIDSRYFGIVNKNQFYKQAILISKESPL